MTAFSLGARLHLGVNSDLAFSLPQSSPQKLKGLTALPPRRSPLVLRLFALALADGSGLPFSLYPPLAALESQTPQREPRRLPPQSIDLALLSKLGVNAFTCRRYNPSVLLLKSLMQQSSSPYTGEPRVARRSTRCDPYTGEPRLALCTLLRAALLPRSNITH